MRHKSSIKKLGRARDPRKMLLRNLATSLILFEKIETTKAKAQAVKPLIDRLIAYSQRDDQVTAIRKLNAVFTHTNASKKVMEVLKDKYKDRKSGFTRMIKMGPRKGDGAEIVKLELV